MAEIKENRVILDLGIFNAKGFYDTEKECGFYQVGFTDLKNRNLKDSDSELRKKAVIKIFEKVYENTKQTDFVLDLCVDFKDVKAANEKIDSLKSNLKFLINTKDGDIEIKITKINVVVNDDAIAFE